MDGQGGEGLAAIVAVPDNHLIGAAAQEAVHGGVNFAGQQLAHLGVLRLGLILAADSGDTFGVGDHENGFPGLRPAERKAEK